MKLTHLLGLSLLIISCNNKKKVDYINVENSNALSQTIHPGKKLLETHCYLCHNPSAPENEGRIAPPMVAIKYHYINDKTTKEQFIKEMVSFTTNPTIETAKMYGAVKQFGLMPKQQFPEGVIEQIADYMFEYQIEEPDWFQNHIKGQGFGNRNNNGKTTLKTNQTKTVEAIGLEYALSTKAVLGKNLMGTIQKKGTLEALNFCNIQAIPLTDSMAMKHNAIIKRVSDKNRNPKNKANTEELKYIELYKKQVAANQEIKPTIIENGTNIQFYYPITTNTMCLQCHGNSEHIAPEIRSKTLKLYPKDLAIGYSENEVRGIWSIQFEKK
ncbi:DUF3365 domain-containing protein [Mariniflexile sp.]|uniref:Tll0287-like domain-containing protein n=1 Tax=Mariniflexile sp. TaxID=1979402 RepID=UPI0035639177